jgi:hypothetical protein
MHININTTSWPDGNISKYMALIHNMPADWLRNIGGRTLNRYCQQLSGATPTYLYDYCVRSHSYAVERGAYRLEARFPNSTTDHVKIVNLLEFFSELKTFVFGHPELWVEPAVMQGPAGYNDRRDYAPVLENFVNFMLQTKNRKRIGSILTYGYPR